MTDTATPQIVTQPLVQDMSRLVKAPSVAIPANSSPANWHILPDGENITARNTVSGATFEGTMEDFNAQLRS